MDNSKKFGKNISYLRKQKNLKQDDMQAHTGVSRATWSDYERDNTEPDFEALIGISKFFGVAVDDLLLKNLELEEYKVEVNGKSGVMKKGQFVEVNVEGNVEVKGVNKHFDNEFKVTVVTDSAADYGKNMAHIPVVDISVAAGGGYYNEGHVETTDAVHLPINFVKRGHTYLCVKIHGISMAPTLQDGGWVVIRLLDRGEWAKMADECVYVVVDREGKSYLKRVKNRFKKGFIVLRSDSPDRASYPSFNIDEKDIAAIWYAEMYFTHKMPNIHDQYYTRLQHLEDRVDEMGAKLIRINP